MTCGTDPLFRGLQDWRAMHSPQEQPEPQSSVANGADGALLDHISQPVLNKPHAEPSRHWQLADDNTATGVAIDGRRPSQAMSIVPKERSAQVKDGRGARRSGGQIRREATSNGLSRGAGWS